MPDPDQTEILHQLASIRRELRFARWLLLFVSMALAILLFAPIWAAHLAEWAAPVATYVPSVVGAIALVVFAAVVVSHYAPSGPPGSTVNAKDPAA